MAKQSWSKKKCIEAIQNLDDPFAQKMMESAKKQGIGNRLKKKLLMNKE